MSYANSSVTGNSLTSVHELNQLISHKSNSEHT